MGSFLQILLNNLHLIGIIALSTLGLTLTYKTANTTNFAQSITSTMGAFVAAYIYMKIFDNAWGATICGIAVCFLIGFVLDTVFVRRVSGKGAGRVMITLGLIILFNAFIPMIFGMIPYEFSRFFNGTLSFTFAGYDLTVTKNGLFIFCASFLVVGILFSALSFTKWGLGVRATAANMQVASLMGINTNRITAMSWAISGACGGLAAIFYASQTTKVGVDMLVTVQSNSLMALVLGGYSTFYGPLLGAIIISVANIVFAMYSGLWSNSMLYIAILLVILVRPEGLFSKTIAKKV